MASQVDDAMEKGEAGHVLGALPSDSLPNSPQPSDTNSLTPLYAGKAQSQVKPSRNALGMSPELVRMLLSA